MAKQKTIPELEVEKAENERKLSQLQHKKQQLENRITYYEKGDRRKRAHHLITRGAAIESVAPLTKVLTETEQEQLKVEIQTLQQDIEVQKRQIENLEQFIQRAHKYKDLDELTPYALRELVKGVYIEAPDKSSGKRRQNIRISYDFVGFIPLNELMKEETA